MMEEGLRELVIAEHRTKAENFKAFGYFIGSIFKAISFGVFGWIITKAMKSFRIQKLNPYNYFFSFLILALPLSISWLMLRKAKSIKNGQQK
jgi:multisubunit Na+/H+ antiporter MnhE subunit